MKKQESEDVAADPGQRDLKLETRNADVIGARHDMPWRE